MRPNTVWRGRNAASAVVLLAAMFQPCPSIADGALAVGVPDDVAQDGFASGFRLNVVNMDAARNYAMADCLRSVGASDKVKLLCKVVATFRNKCVAIAIDSKSGSPGVGWAIAESQKMADKQAIDQCRTTAGPDRRDFCVVMQDRGVSRGCDGNAK